ncbi:hypothetical protein XM38_006270 [Halomicronema hongdechloris C2206]|uniref:Uncharacterized protein n=1 Tax=Halomicronema hongdechloris C2206 TaxID=1641165 RepID=A0A1Z3HHG1_9CYAN|nr:hypothetical protein [Halomicronema hongdechloris]ASC69698.1 hypothetical protein XM38_006270 [Halomicronema hongdechloris C2206]
MATDILILTVYFICVAYVGYQMALSIESQLEDQLRIDLDREALQTAVTSQVRQQPGGVGVQVATDETPGLQLQVPLRSHDREASRTGTVIVRVMPLGQRPPQPPLNHLTVQVVNGLDDRQLFIDWDSSSLSLQNNQGRRVIRQVPGQFMDLAQAQVMSVVNPDQTITAQITSEDAFQRHPDTRLLQPTVPLINLEQAMLLPSALRQYSLRLMLRIRPMAGEDAPSLRLLIPFQFRIEVLPGQIAVPVLNWLLNR